MQAAKRTRTKFATWLIRFRHERGYSQPKLASLLGRSGSTSSYLLVWNWESGKKRPNLENLNKLAELAKKPVQELLDLLV